MTIIATVALLIGLGILAAVLVRLIGGDIKSMADWKVAGRYYTTWGMAFVALIPELWNGLLSAGYMSGDDVSSEVSWFIKLTMIGTFLLGRIKQVERPQAPDFGQK